jgi:hypothetical protein
VPGALRIELQVAESTSVAIDAKVVVYAFTPWRTFWGDDSVNCHAALAHAQWSVYCGISDGGVVRASRASQAVRMNAKILRFC